MPTYMKYAAAAALVIAVGGFAIWQLGAPGPGGQPTPSPTPAPTAVPTAVATVRPTLAGYIPPALSGTFTSDIHGLSISYPEGWTTEAATAVWTTSGGPFSFGDSSADYIFDPQRESNLFLALASQPLGGMTFAEWSTSGLLANEGCGSTSEPVVVDGANGIVCGNLALVSSGDRGYVIKLYTGDDQDLSSFDDAAWFEEVLATAQLRPTDAVK